MSQSTGFRTFKITGAGILALLISYSIIHFPAWKEQWLYRFYQNQTIFKTIDEAKAINPFLTKDYSLAAQLLFQDLLLQAGSVKRLNEQYALTAKEYPDDANVQAYYARVLNDSFQREAVLKRAVELDPNDPAVLVVQAEEALRQNQPQQALEFCNTLEDGNWFTHGLRARAYSQLGNYNQAKDEFKKAVDCENVPVSILLAYARLLSEYDEEGKASNPFSGWDEDQLNKEPLAFAYHTYLAGTSISKIVQEFGQPVMYHPQALLILAKAALHQGAINTADRLLQKAHRLQPSNLDITVYRGIVALRQGNVVLANSILSDTPKNMPYSTEDYHAKTGEILWKENENGICCISTI